MGKDSTEGDFCREFCERFGGLFALCGPELVRRAADSLLAIRPLASPNRLVLRLGLEEFLPHPLGQTLSKALVEEQRIRRNFVDWKRVGGYPVTDSSKTREDSFFNSKE